MRVLPGAQELKKFKAKRLYVKQLYSGNQAAIKAGVTPKTIGKWIKDGNWNEEREKRINQLVGEGSTLALPEIIVNDFLEFIKENAPHLATKVQPIVNEYLKLN